MGIDGKDGDRGGVLDMPQDYPPVISQTNALVAFFVVSFVFWSNHCQQLSRHSVLSLTEKKLQDILLPQQKRHERNTIWTMFSVKSTSTPPGVINVHRRLLHCLQTFKLMFHPLSK